VTDFSAVTALLDDAPWIADRLELYAKLVGVPGLQGDLTVEANLLSSADYLRRWLPIYIHAYELAGEEPPLEVEDIFPYLDELIEFLNSDLLQSVDVSRGAEDATIDRRL
jgi:hypothetical protein